MTVHALRKGITTLQLLVTTVTPSPSTHLNYHQKCLRVPMDYSLTWRHVYATIRVTPFAPISALSIESL